MSSTKKKCGSLLCALLALLLCACGGTPDSDEVPPPEEAEQPFTLSVSIPFTGNAAQSSETVMVHLYENLMRWADGGDGWAVLAPGLAESYEMETDYAGNATYTFTLREGICWSSGEPITASDFVSSWQMLADEEPGTPHRELLSCIAGFDGVTEDIDKVEDAGEPANGGDEQEADAASRLAVSAPDARTFVVTLKGNPAYFLEEVCASVYTVPGSGKFPDGPANGPYIVGEADASRVVLVRNEKYYAPDPAGPEEIHFYAAGEADHEYQQLQDGARDLITALPTEVLQTLADGGLWTAEPVTETYGILLNTRKAPFDNENVRMAFHLAVDRQAVVDALGDLTARPAPGIVPYGVSDYSERPVAEEELPEDTLPDPNAPPEPEQPAAVCWDFRMHSLQVVTAEHVHNYESDRSYAQALLANAGYPGGNGFPEVEYLYVSGSDAASAVAQALQSMWKDCLGVSVAIRGVSQEEYDAALSPAPPEEGDGEGEAAPDGSEEDASGIPAFTMAGQTLCPVYSDAEVLLNHWHSASVYNVSGYASDAFDILLNAARDVVSPDARDAYLHDAEAILLDDSPVIPVFCRGGSYQLAEGLAGLYRAPDQVFFLYNVHRESMGN